MGRLSDFFALIIFGFDRAETVNANFNSNSYLELSGQIQDFIHKDCFQKEVS